MLTPDFIEFHKMYGECIAEIKNQTSKHPSKYTGFLCLLSNAALAAPEKQTFDFPADADRNFSALEKEMLNGHEAFDSLIQELDLLTLLYGKRAEKFTEWEKAAFMTCSFLTTYYKLGWLTLTKAATLFELMESKAAANS